MSGFIKGLDLCEQFFFEVAQSILDKFFPSLKYTAGLIGYGSDVLGYDDSTSTDHMWGPRFYLFLDEKDIKLTSQIQRVFAQNLPYTFKGHSVHFSLPDINDNGIRAAILIDKGEVSPLIFIQTIDEFLKEYIGICDFSSVNDLDWLAFSEHKLLGLTSGKLFVDKLLFQRKLDFLNFYPINVKLYLIASNWSLIAEEQAFVKRTGVCNDDIGSRLVCARIVERLMRLCFLYANRYAPYSKWFGTAFKNLTINNEISHYICLALSADNVLEREDNLIAAQVLVGEIHNQSALTDLIDIKVHSYFSREIKVISPDNFAVAIREKLQNTMLQDIPLIGTLSQIANFTALTDKPQHRQQIKELYKK